MATFRARSEQIVRYLQLSPGSTSVREAIRDDLEESIAEVAISELEPLCSSTALRGAAVRALDEAGLDFMDLDASDTVARQAETATLQVQPEATLFISNGATSKERTVHHLCRNPGPLGKDTVVS